MISVISPSKNLIENPGSVTEKYSLPDFLPESEMIVEKLRKFSPKQLAKLMNINPKLAELNFGRYITWNKAFSPENAERAVLMFNGEVFNGLQAGSLNENDLFFAQEHVRILSGLYGILRPLDLMQAYRLEMGTKLTVNRRSDLYRFWGEKLTENLNKSFENQEEKVLVNLASDEYFHALQTKKLNARVIKCQFKEERNGKLKFVTVYGKKARGLMLKFIIQNRLEKSEDLKAFDLEGYYFNSSFSTDDLWMFSR